MEEPLRYGLCSVCKEFVNSNIEEVVNGPFFIAHKQCWEEQEKNNRIEMIDDVEEFDNEDINLYLYKTPPKYKPARIQLDIETSYETLVLNPRQIRILYEFLKRNLEKLPLI